MNKQGEEIPEKVDVAKDFYNHEYSDGQSSYEWPDGNPYIAILKKFVGDYGLENKRCLEVGCGRGDLQDLVDDYTGIDLAESIRPFMRKPFFACSAAALPFPDSSFDAIWSITVLEHVPEPENALREILRVSKSGGIIYLEPAWQCRPWAADGYAVRPYSDFGIHGKLIKAMIPIRESVIFRSLYVFPLRIARLAGRLLFRGSSRFKYRKLNANYTKFWVSDSDACNSMDPHEAILWFRSRGCECLSHPGGVSSFLVRTGPIIFRIRK